MWTRQQVARTIDHAVLKPFATDRDVIAGCALSRRYEVASICVRPSDVPLAAAQMQGSPVKVCVVVGFPHGANCAATKAAETRLALAQGAAEVDMVMNIGQFLSGHYEVVQKDIEAVVAEARQRGALVKVILETCWLAPEQIETACRVCQAAGADFVKTSTGFGDGQATPAAIDIMLRTVGQTMGVKASGGIHSWETALGYLTQGCKRLGMAATQAVLEGAGNDGRHDHY